MPLKDETVITAEILLDLKCINFSPKKQFKLTSGKKSPIYCDCRRIISFPKERPCIETVIPFPRSWLNLKPKEPPIDKLVELPIDCISKFEPALIVISAFAVPTKPAARTDTIAISFFIVIYPFIDKFN